MTNKIEKCKDSFFAACPTGLEELLCQEIKALPYQKVEVVKGGVHFEAPAKVALELLLSSRIASRVYKKQFQFNFNNEKNLYSIASEIKWKAVFNLDQTFKISVIQGKSKSGEKRSRFKSTMFLAQNLKDAIVDRFRDDCKGERPSVDKENPNVSILMRVEPSDDENSSHEVCTILIDMTGAPLSHRGYRNCNFSAPLKENLAAGIVMLSGYDGSQHLIDPMCGSGTLVIESLLIKGKIPPSYLALHEIVAEKDENYWDFMQHNWFVKDKYLQADWKKLLEIYIEKSRDGFDQLAKAKTKTYAYDNHNFALSSLQANLAASELKDFVILDKADATTLKPEVDSGLVITNPPYGERIGKDDDLDKLYYDLGENLKKNFTNFKAYIFTGNVPMIKKISLRTSKKIILWNGNLECRLVEYKLF